MTQNYLQISHLNKSYGQKHALKNINIHVRSGEKVALLGCNGAGKSTLINIITGLKSLTSGEVSVFGLNPTNLSAKVQSAYLPQTLKFSGFLKVKEVIRLIEKHYQTKIDPNILIRLELDSLLNRFCHGLSGGEERKLGLALCLIGHRPLLILDEPTANVDLVAKNEIHKILIENVKNSEKSILFSSHEMQEVDKLADRVIVLNHGEIIAEGNVSKIKKTFGISKVTFETLAASSSNTSIETSNHAVLNPIELSTSTKIESHPSKTFDSDNVDSTTYEVYGPDSDLIISELVQKNIKFKNLIIEQPSLDEIFMKLWGQKV